jgi:hypothetical protein
MRASVPLLSVNVANVVAPPGAEPGEKEPE